MTVRKTRKGGDATRDRLIEAAFTVVARDGIEAASVKNIAAEAGVTPGLTHYHFPSKDALLKAAMCQALDDYRARVRARREESLGGGDPLGAFFDDAVGSAEEYATFFRVRLAFAAQALVDPGVAEALASLNAAAIEETALTLAAATGRAEPGERELALAATLKGAFDGLMLAWLTNPDFPTAAAGKILENGARAWLGLLPRSQA
ncbi:MAG: TetR/AcrR family transcriptional regulator [Caulobacter sp.]